MLQVDRCADVPTFVELARNDTAERLAECHERLGDAVGAEECRAEARQIRDTLSWRQVEADTRPEDPPLGGTAVDLEPSPGVVRRLRRL